MKTLSEQEITTAIRAARVTAKLLFGTRYDEFVKELSACLQQGMKERSCGVLETVLYVNETMPLTETSAVALLAAAAEILELEDINHLSTNPKTKLP